MGKTEKKVEPTLLVRLSITGEMSYLRPDVDKKKIKTRGPKETGQRKINIPFAMNGVSQEEYEERITVALQILKGDGKIAEAQELAEMLEKETGKVKVLTASESSLKKELEKVNELLAAEKAKVTELSKEPVKKKPANKKESTPSQ